MRLQELVSEVSVSASSISSGIRGSAVRAPCGIAIPSSRSRPRIKLIRACRVRIHWARFDAASAAPGAREYSPAPAQCPALARLRGWRSCRLGRSCSVADRGERTAPAEIRPDDCDARPHAPSGGRSRRPSSPRRPGHAYRETSPAARETAVGVTLPVHPCLLPQPRRRSSPSQSQGSLWSTRGPSCT